MASEKSNRDGSEVIPSLGQSARISEGGIRLSDGDIPQEYVWGYLVSARAFIVWSRRDFFNSEDGRMQSLWNFVI